MPQFHCRFLCLLLVFAAPGPVAWSGVAGDRLALARGQLERLDFQAGSKLAQSALTAGDADPTEVRALHALLAETAAALGRTSEAEREFGVVLALDPSFTLGRGASPRVRAPYESARSRAVAPLTVQVDSRSLGGAPVSTRVSAESDALGLARSARLYIQENGRFIVRDVKVPLPAAFDWRCELAPCSYFVSVQDAFGNELLRRGSPLAALVVSGAGRAPAPRPFLRAGTLLAGLSILAAVSAVTFGLEYAAKDRTLQSTAHQNVTYASASTLDDARRLDYGLMLGSVGVCAGGGAVAILTW